jgi:hypothetical protein
MYCKVENKNKNIKKNKNRKINKKSNCKPSFGYCVSVGWFGRCLLPGLDGVVGWMHSKGTGFLDCERHPRSLREKAKF